MKTVTIRDLYPNLNDEQLAEVEDTWDRYLALVIRIYNRIIEEKGHDEMARIIAATKANK